MLLNYIGGKKHTSPAEHALNQMSILEFGSYIRVIFGMDYLVIS